MSLTVCVFLPAPSFAPVQLSSPAETPGDLQPLLSHHTRQRCGAGQCHVHMCKLHVHTVRIHAHTHTPSQADQAVYKMTILLLCVTDSPGFEL